MSSKKLGSGAVKAEDALQGQRVKTRSGAAAEPGGRGLVLDFASEQPVMEGEGTRVPVGRSGGVHEMFRSSRVKVEALDARRVELSQTSASAEDAAKSPANDDNSAPPQPRSVTETARPAGEDADVKYEWQATRPRVCALPDETDGQVVELVVVADAAPATSDTALRSREADRSEQGTRSSREDEPFKSRGTTAGKDDSRTREGYVDGAGSSVYAPALLPEEVGASTDHQLGGAEVAGGPHAGAQAREPLGPGGVAHLETVPVPGVEHSRGNSVVPPVNLIALQERGLQPTGKGQSYVETLHKLRVCQKSEIGTHASLSDEKVSVHLTGVNIFETSYWNERARNHSSGAASGQPSVPRKSVALPDLNEGGPTAAVVKPCLDEQQEEQLRAQILVYGALIHGNQIDESLMESAFGDGNSAEYRSESGKKCLWEESWRSSCERLKANKLTGGLMFPAQGASERTAMPDVVLSSNNLAATGIHVEVVATPDEVPDSPVSSNSPASPEMDSNEAQTMEVTFDPVAPPLEIAAGNPEGTGPVTSELLQALDVTEGSIPVTSESQASLITPATAASGQGNLLVLVENTSAHVDNLPNPAPLQLADVVEMVGGSTLDAFSNMVVKGSSMHATQPSHAKRSPLNVPRSETEGIRNRHTSEIPDAIPMASLEAAGAGVVPEQIERAIDTPDGVARTVGAGDEVMEDVLMVAPPDVSPEQSNVAQHSADATQAVAPTYGATLIKPTSSNPGHPISELRQDNFERDASQLDQARSRAEEAAADAAATLQHSTAIWTRVDAGDHSGLTADQEDTLAFAAASLAAAASVAKGAAAAAKVAFEAASLASLMVQESTAKVHPSVSSVGQGVLHAAREQTLKRAEDAAAASKRAQLLNAVARAAELATEAAEQTGAVISMGDPLRFSLQDLQQAGLNEHWKLGLTTKIAQSGGQTKAPVKRPSNRKRLSQPSQSQTKVKEKAATTSPGGGIFKKESASLKKKKEKSELKGLKVTKKKSVAVRLRATKPLAATVPLARARDRSSKTLAKPRLLKVAQNGSASPKTPHQNPPGPLSRSTRSPLHLLTSDVGAKETGHVPDGSITEGSVVEVLADEEGLRGAWFSGKVLRIQGVEALVVYDEILADDGTTPLQELVPLGSKGGGPPKIRLAHPINFPKNESAKKRRRTGLGNRTWVIGEAVDAWIRDGWWEGKIEAVNHEDETKVTVHFPGEGDTSVIKSWDLRPSLVWRHGNWVISEPQAQEDGPAAKRQKVASKPSRAKPKKGKGTKRALSGAKGAVEVNSLLAIKKGTSETETKLKGLGGEQDAAKKRKLAEISEDGGTGNSRRILLKENAAAGDEGHGEKEKGGTKVEKQPSKKKSTKTQVLTDGEQTPQVSTAARTRRAGGQQAMEIGPEPEKGGKSSKQATGGQGKASTITKSPKQAPVVQGKASPPAKKGKKPTGRKKSTKRTAVKETIPDKETPPGKDSPSTKAAKDTPLTKEAVLAKATPSAKGTSRAKGAPSDKSVPPVTAAKDVPPAKAVPATRSAPPVNDVLLENDVPPSKGVVATSKDVTPSRETNGIQDTPAKDGRRGSNNQPDAGSSAKRLKVQRSVKARRATGQNRRKSSRKVQATPQVVESEGNLNKQDSKQGWKSDEQFGTRAKTVNQAVNILRAHQLQLLP